MRKSMKLTAAFLLSLALLFGSIPSAVYAAEVSAQTQLGNDTMTEKEVDVSDSILQTGGFVSEEDISAVHSGTAGKKNAAGAMAAATDKAAVMNLLYQAAISWDGTATTVTAQMGGIVCTTEDLRSIYPQFVNENPDLFYLTGRYSYSYNSGGNVIRVTMYCDPDSFGLSDVTTFHNKVSAILSNVESSWSDEQKALFLHDYIVTHCEYDLTYSNYTAYHTLVTGSSVCQGYSLAYYYLLKQCGIEAYIISSDDMNHAWNQVTINGKKYYTDCTWDDPVASSSSTFYQDYCRHVNFLRSQTGITETGHDSTDWVDQTGEAAYGTSTGSQYENAWWSGTVTAIPHVGNLWAYAPSDGAVIYAHDYASGSDRQLANTGAFWPVWDGGGYYYTNTYIHLAADDDHFYASAADQIYQIGTDGTLKVFYELTNNELASGYIYGIRIEDDTLYYRLYTSYDSSTFVEEKQIALSTHTHKWGAGVVTKEATCTEDGIRTYTCSVCGKTKTETIKATGHTEVADPAVEATCTEPGKTAGSHCSVCGEVFKAQEEIPALGHDWDGGKITKAATCTEAGVKTYTCKRCGETQTEEIKATGHTIIEDPAVEATCTEPGKTAGSHCSVCGEVLQAQEVIPAKGHQFGEWITNGEENHKHTCAVCGLEEAEVHVWGEPEITKEATEDEEGLRTYTCLVCAQTRTEVIPKTDHVHEYVETVVPPTCTEQGYTLHKCEKCGDEYKDTFTEALGHTEIVVPAEEATCTEPGKTEGSHCSVCGEVIKAQEEIPALGHDWDEGIVTKEATNDEDGEMTYTCKRCGEEKTEVIPRLDIISVTAVTVEPSEKEMATSQTIKKKPYTITKASTLQLTAKIEPENAANKNVTWSSSDPTVATVDENGMVTALTYGKTTITVTTEDGGKTASCQIQTRYNDVAESGRYWFKPVYWAADNNITKGYENIYFGPEENCTREQMITFLYRTAGSPAVSGSVSFSDVKKGSYYYNAVLWAYNNGITKGYSSGPYKGKFGVGLNVTREDTVTFIYRMAGKPKYTTTKSFSDVKKGNYYYDPVRWAAENGITKGYDDGTFGVGKDVLRKDIVTFLYRYANMK